MTQATPSVDSPEVLDRFFAHLSLVDILAAQLVRTLRGPVQLDDLVSAGREGLLDVARRYDPTHGTSFKTFATYRVKGAMMDQVRQLAPVPRRIYDRLLATEAAALVGEGQVGCAFAEPPSPVDEQGTEGELEATIDAMVASAAFRLQAEAARDHAPEATPEDPESSYARAELLHLAKEEIERLPVEEGNVVRRFYFEEHRLEDIARDLGVSKSWVSRIHRRAVARLSTRILPPGCDDDDP